MTGGYWWFLGHMDLNRHIMSKLHVMLQHLGAYHPVLLLYLRLHITQVLWLLFRLRAVIIDYWFSGS
jgi:hypothetical protein